MFIKCIHFEYIDGNNPETFLCFVNKIILNERRRFEENMLNMMTMFFQQQTRRYKLVSNYNKVLNSKNFMTVNHKLIGKVQLGRLQIASKRERESQALV